MWMPRRSISLPAAPTTLPPRVIALTALSGVESFAAFSPDGNSIAFSWNGEKGDNFDIYVKDIGSSGARQLTKDPGRDVSPVWSPDGRQIAFVRFDGVAGRLHITSALTASEVKLSALPPVPDRLKPTLWCKSIDWSLDGYIAAQYEPLDTAASLPNRGIYFVPVEGGAARPVTHPKTPAVDSCPAFSPDGRHLAFARCASSAAGRCDVHVIDLDAGLDATGPTRQLTKEGIPDVTGVAWARDGNSLVFGTRGGTLQTLWRVPVDGSQRPEQINIAGSAAVPAVARTHDRLAFSRDMNDVESVQFSTRAPITVLAQFDQRRCRSPVLFGRSPRRVRFLGSR